MMGGVKYLFYVYTRGGRVAVVLKILLCVWLC